MTTLKKSLGQNFLTCEWAVMAIIHAAALEPDDTVLEIGPGNGVLTKKIAAKVRRVIAVEKDDRFAVAFSQKLKKEGVTNIDVIRGDILEKLPSLKGHYTKVVANIPYYLTSRLVRMLLSPRLFEKTNINRKNGASTQETQKNSIQPALIVLTLQKEVAQRICARARHMNLLALSVQTLALPKIIKTVPASCFLPRPKVDSAIIRLSPLPRPFFGEHLDQETFFGLAHLAFSQKRKMLTNTLRRFGDKTVIERVLKHAGLNPKARPQEVTKEQWRKIILALDKKDEENSPLLRLPRAV